MGFRGRASTTHDHPHPLLATNPERHHPPCPNPERLRWVPGEKGGLDGNEWREREGKEGDAVVSFPPYSNRGCCGSRSFAFLNSLYLCPQNFCVSPFFPLSFSEAQSVHLLPLFCWRLSRIYTYITRNIQAYIQLYPVQVRLLVVRWVAISRMVSVWRQPPKMQSTTCGYVNLSAYKHCSSDAYQPQCVCPPFQGISIPCLCAQRQVILQSKGKRTERPPMLLLF